VPPGYKKHKGKGDGEMMTRKRAIEAITDAMPNWKGTLNDLYREDGETIKELAFQAIHLVDRTLAYGSETVGLGNALDDIKACETDAGILDTLDWWDKAYQAQYLTTFNDGQGHGGILDEDDEPCPQVILDRIHELTFSGNSGDALKLAERWSWEELTEDEQEEFGISYEKED
jgi:hypothetical protein